MSTFESSRQIIQKSCAGLASLYPEASAILNKENIDKDSVSVKVDSVAVASIREKHQAEAKLLGGSLNKLQAAVHAYATDGSKPTGVQLSDNELKVFQSIISRFRTSSSSSTCSSSPSQASHFDREFQTFVNSYHRTVLGAQGESSIQDMALYKKSLLFLATSDKESSRARQFNGDGALRLRFEERLERLSCGKDKLPHFSTALNSEEYKQLETFLKTMSAKTTLTPTQKQTLIQAFLDYRTIRNDTVNFSGELFRLPNTTKEYRESKISQSRLAQITAMAEANRARPLDQVLAMGAIFCSGRANPLVNIVPFNAERQLSHEILMHLMLERGLRDEDFKHFHDLIYPEMLELDPTLLTDMEKHRESAEESIRSELMSTQLNTAADLEAYVSKTLQLTSKMELDFVLQALDREQFVKDLSTDKRENLVSLLAMRLADSAAQRLMAARVTKLMTADKINKIDGLPEPVPMHSLAERRVFTVNGGAASGKSTTTRHMLDSGSDGIDGLVTITRDALMTSLLDPSKLAAEDLDYYAAFGFDEAVLIANYVERVRQGREAKSGEGPHLFFDLVRPDTKTFKVGVESGGIRAALVNMPVETSVFLAQLRGEKEKRYAGKICVLATHKLQVLWQRQAIEFLKDQQKSGKSLDKVESTIVTKVGKDFNPYPTVNFDFKNDVLDVNSAGYFYDFLRKDSIDLSAETMTALYGYPEMSDEKYAELFMSFAQHFDSVKIKVLQEDLSEVVQVFSKDKYDELQKLMATPYGKLSASTQRLRQKMFEPLRNAAVLIEQAKKFADDQYKATDLLATADKQLNNYIKEYGTENLLGTQLETSCLARLTQLQDAIAALKAQTK